MLATGSSAVLTYKALVEKGGSFDLESYFPAVVAEFQAAGRDVEITRKEKKVQTRVESAFLKDTTELYDLKAIPTLYLLDASKTVMLKDVMSVPYIEDTLYNALEQ